MSRDDDAGIDVEAIGIRAAERVHVARFRMDVEGFWTGRCLLCGCESGMSLGEPDEEARHYIVCPACPGRGRDGTVIWERAEPE